MTELLRAEALSKHFVSGGGFLGGQRQVLRAVEEVSLQVERGRTLGLVGESGCGKSTVGRLLVGLVQPTEGRVFLGDQELSRLPEAHRRALRREVQMVFQDPAAALNPHLTIRQALEEPFEIHEPGLAPGERGDRIHLLAGRMGLRDELLDRRPRDLSGGQRQRVVIARALALAPAFLFADEPVASLDASVRAQVLNLLVDLQRERNLGYLFVSHDLRVVRHLADEVMVMYLGRIVEHNTAEAFFRQPRHPYAQVLVSSSPGGDRRIVLQGEVPSPLEVPQGCPFHPRCPLFQRLSSLERQPCLEERPRLLASPGGGETACHHAACPPLPSQAQA